MRNINIITLIAFVIFITSCKTNTNEIKIESNKADNTTSVSVKATQKYLLLPMEDTGREVKVDLSIDDENNNFFIVRLAEKQIDYWMPLDISEWNGKTIKLSFPDPDSDLGIKAIKLSDTFDFDYNEKYRPGYHFSPLYGWMNDPNGMVYYDGEYHLFYQHNPFGTRWQNMSWGHAVSKDLIRWEHLPEGLWPDSLGTIFSGCAVVDENNTTGLQKGNEKTLLAFFTHSERQGQFQSLAYSNDKGRTWIKYENNPILRHETARDFRDPKVFWHDASERWMMILAVGQVMEIYSSFNAIDWTYESNFGEGYGAHGGVWECPDLFELPIEGSNKKKWVLICNINPGGPFGGSATQYFIGNFDGKTFHCENKPEETHWMDWGKDHYAAVTWANVSGRKIAVAWMSNWEYANDVPTTQFRSANGIPRELKLIERNKEIVLASYPIKETESLRKEERIFTDISVSDEQNIDNLLENNNGQYELLIDIESCNAEIIGFKLFNTVGEFIDCYLSLSEKKFAIDRRHSGNVKFNEHFPSVTFGPITQKETYRFRILVDKASVECFEGDGEMAMTNLIFPSEPYNRIAFYAKGGNCEIKKMTIYSLTK